MTPIEKGLSTYKQTSRNAGDRHRLDRFDQATDTGAKERKPSPFARLLQQTLEKDRKLSNQN